MPLKSFMVGKITQRFFVFLFLKIQHSSENGRSGYKKDKQEKEAATASSRHMGTGRPRQGGSRVEEMWAAGVRTQSERKSGEEEHGRHRLPQQERGPWCRLLGWGRSGFGGWVDMIKHPVLDLLTLRCFRDIQGEMPSGQLDDELGAQKRGSG